MSDHEKHAHLCPHCAAPLTADVKTCWTCGEGVSLNLPRKGDPTATAADEPTPLAVALTMVHSRGSRPASPPGGWSTAKIALAGGLTAMVAIFAMTWSQLAPPRQPATQSAPRATAPAPNIAPIVESAPPPTWIGARQAAWANDGSKIISFELKATSDVPVWMSRVRPLLVVRCLYRATEVFVAIRSSASIEGSGGNHTVRLAIDDDPETAQQWTDSVTGQELFAPNPVALTRRLASAERLRFTFTPYNAPPVSAEFSVRGFQPLADLVGKTCGWRLDDPAAQKIRTAGIQ